jgi:uncharacterized membrane protein YphA (DoxX/SURF4 family)
MNGKERRVKKGTVRVIFSVLTAVVFIVSAIAKWVDIRDFELYVFSFGFLDFDPVTVLSRLLVVLELGTGLWLLSGWKPLWARALAIVELVGFSVFLFWRLVVGDDSSCHCFGNLVDINPEQSLIKNAVLLLCVFLCSTKEFPFARVSRFLLFAAVVISGVSLFVSNPPDLFYRMDKNDNSHIVREYWEKLAEKERMENKSLVCFFSTTCDNCVDFALKLEGSLKRNKINAGDLRVFFMNPGGDDPDSAAIAFFEKNMGGNIPQWSFLPANEILPLTGGNLPLVVLCDGSTVIKEYDYLSFDGKDVAAFLKEP